MDATREARNRGPAPHSPPSARIQSTGFGLAGRGVRRQAPCLPTRRWAILAGMRSDVRVLRGTRLLLSLGCALAAPPTGAQEAETQRWVPAFSVYSGALVQGADGQVASGPILGPPGPSVCNPASGIGCIRPAAAGDDLVVSAFVAGSAELMTPGLAFVPGRPRLFVHAGVGGLFGSTRDVAKEGSPDAFVLPDPDLIPPDRVTAGQIRGQGSGTSVEVQPLLVSAGVGIAFTLHVWERRLRIKPSFEYLREEIELSGVVNRVVTANPDGNCPFPAPADTRFRCIQLRGSDSKVYHGIGPGLEIELDAARAGPFMLAVFVAGQGYSFLGDLEMRATGTNEFGETAVWQAEKDRWGFRGGVGLRFRWLPE